ncbi:MAG: hypothetical protein ACLRSL_03415 [Streptococcus sp.]
MEAGDHTYASRSGQAQGLSSWIAHPDQQQVLEGQLTLPLPIATKEAPSDSIQVFKWLMTCLKSRCPNSCADYCFRWPGSKLCALKALVSIGIQHGHMKLS